MTNPPPPPYPPPPGFYPPPPPPPRRNNTTWIVLGVIAVAIFVLCGGCLAIVGIGSSGSNHAGATSTSRPRPVSTEPASRTTVAPQSTPTSAFSDQQVADMAFLAALKKNNVPISSDDAAITLGHAVCEGRAGGNSETAIALTIADKGFTVQQAGIIVGASEAAYCPQ